jgi:hypothetical protein
MTRHEEIIKSIHTKDIRIAELHTALKIILTLPMIEKYQKEYLPSTKPIQQVDNEMIKVIKKLDSSMNK